MIIVGICGASGSGKSTLARKIEESLNCSVKTIGQDCYYVDHSDMPFTERVHINYDAPHSFDHSALFEDVSPIPVKAALSIPARRASHHQKRL